MPLVNLGSQLAPIPILVINGDSLSVSGTNKWPNRLILLRPPLSLHNYAVGSTSVLDCVAAVEAMSVADKARTQFICFGMPDRNTSDEYIQAADDVMAAIGHERVILCTPVTGDYEQFYPEGAAYDARIEAHEYILETYPDNAFDIFQALMDGSDGSPGDLEDVANGITPRSLRTDEVHWNDAGHVVVAEAAAEFWASRNWP